MLDLDLTGLDKAAAQGGAGKPIEFVIEDVVEDPDQPRQDFDEDELEQLARNIKQRGVRSPISVKPKNAAGKHVINHGARRYRASKIAGRPTIPGFIDETHDKYDQVAENLLRANLTPMSLALFCAGREKAGDSRKTIAENLGQKSTSFMSEILPLIDAPDFIQAMARKKKHSGKTLYLLLQAWKTRPAEIEAYVASTEEITRPGIKAVLGAVDASTADQGAPDGVFEQLPPEGGGTVAPHVAGDLDVLTGDVPALSKAPGSAAPAGSAGLGSTPPSTAVSSAAAGWPSAGAAEASPAAGHRPKPGPKPIENKTGGQLSISVRINGRIARLNQAGKVSVTFDETGETTEIDFAAVEIVGTKSV